MIPSTPGEASGAVSTGLLLRLDAGRVRASLVRPSAGAWIGAGLPAVLLAVAVGVAGGVVRPRMAGAEDGVTLGVLLSAPVAFLAYGTLFRGADGPFLRRLAVPDGVLFGERALRLLASALGLAALILLAFASGGAPLGGPAVVAVSAAVASWGAAVASLCGAARMMAGRAPGQGWGCLSTGSGFLGMRVWDREVAAAAPLVYAPLPPLLVGAVAGGVAAAPGAAAVTAVVVAAAAVLMVAAAARWYRQAAPRFAPQTLEMSFAPPVVAGAGELAPRRGAARLLPRPVAAVWARDALVAERRFGWATRIVWPVAVLSLVALARWGESPATRAWVAAAAVSVFLLQAVAVLGMGRVERAGRRWIDRSLGLSAFQRVAGRWMWGWGMGLWLAFPLSLAWGWWAGGGSGWFWVGVGGATSLVSALASTASGARWR